MASAAMLGATGCAFHAHHVATIAQGQSALDQDTAHSTCRKCLSPTQIHESVFAFGRLRMVVMRCGQVVDVEADYAGSRLCIVTNFASCSNDGN